MDGTVKPQCPVCKARFRGQRRQGAGPEGPGPASDGIRSENVVDRPGAGQDFRASVSSRHGHIDGTERAGFEPAVQVYPVRQFSKLLPGEGQVSVPQGLTESAKTHLAENLALFPDLRAVVESWSLLPAAVRRKITSIVRGRVPVDADRRRADVQDALRRAHEGHDDQVDMEG